MSRCCGRCDGVNDICVADTFCDAHNVEGCEVCFGKRENIKFMKEYTHKEKAVNFVMSFASITNDSIITNIAKQSAIVALNRNIDNLKILESKMKQSGYNSLAGGFSVLLHDEKCILHEVENL